jgi:iron complex transport system ATP-binding protein
MTLAAQELAVAVGARLTLDRVSLACAAGEIVGLVGPNGAGKSTLLRTLAGLVVPQRGGVSLDGAPILGLDATARARAITYLPQSRHIHWPVSVEALVGLGRLPWRAPGAGLSSADRQAIEAAMRALDVQHLAERPATELSGGELARVLAARALAQGGRVLLADEPSSGLDPAHQLALFERFAALARQGLAVVVALHDLSIAARYCHTVVLLHQGRVLTSGPPAEVLTPALIRTAYAVEAYCGAIDGVPVIVPLRAA